MFDLIRLRLRALLFCAFYFTGMAPVAAQGTNAAAVAAPRAIAVAPVPGCREWAR